MNRQAAVAAVDASHAGVVESIVQLAREASIEINVDDVRHLEASRALLAPRTKMYVSHLPKQTWQQTAVACSAVRASGFLAVPHLPVRLMADEDTLDRTLAELVGGAQVEEVLLIAGECKQAVGPYSTVADVLANGALERHGLRRVSLAGHPEGHPKVALDELRRAEREKVMLATQAGLDVTLLTQFFFEHPPFLRWVGELRAQGIRARVVAGLAGPARLATLVKFAIRCGVGPSVRVLTAHPSSLVHLIGVHGPEHVVRGLAQARSSGEAEFSGIHLFSLGGYLRTCEWLQRVAHGRFTLDARGGFDVVIHHA